MYLSSERERNRAKPLRTTVIEETISLANNKTFFQKTFL